MVTFDGKTRIKYEKVSLPKEMVDEIKHLIENEKWLGFVSIQEFVKESARRSIIQYNDVKNGK
jgi:hypothetical protein